MQFPTTTIIWPLLFLLVLVQASSKPNNPDVSLEELRKEVDALRDRIEELVADEVRMEDISKRAFYGSKRAMIPYSGGIYGKRGGPVPFSGGIYGKRSVLSEPLFFERPNRAMPFNGGMYG